MHATSHPQRMSQKMIHLLDRVSEYSAPITGVRVH